MSKRFDKVFGNLPFINENGWFAVEECKGGCDIIVPCRDEADTARTKADLKDFLANQIPPPPSNKPIIPDRRA